MPQPFQSGVLNSAIGVADPAMEYTDGPRGPSYSIFRLGNNFYARNGVTGLVDYTGNTSVHTVFNAAAAALTSGGSIAFMGGRFDTAASLLIPYSGITVKSETEAFGSFASDLNALSSFATVGDPLITTSTNASNVTIRNLHVNGNSGKAGIGIDIDGGVSTIAKTNRVEHCRITGCDTAVRLKGYSTTVRHCDFVTSTDSTQYRMNYGVYCDPTVAGGDHKIHFNNVFGAQKACVYMINGCQLIGNDLVAAKVTSAVWGTFGAVLVYVDGATGIGGGGQITGNYLDEVNQGPAILVKPTQAPGITRVLIIGANWWLGGGDRNITDTADADGAWPAIAIDDSVQPTGEVVIERQAYHSKGATARLSRFLEVTTTAAPRVILNTGIIKFANALYNNRPGYVGPGFRYDGSTWFAEGDVIPRGISGAISDGSFPSAPIDGTMALRTDNRRMHYRAGAAWNPVQPEKRFTLTDAATVTPDCLNGNYQTLAAAAGRTIANALNRVDGTELTIQIKNTTGGAITTTWNVAYKTTGIWVDPAAGKVRQITFKYDGTDALWYVTSFTPADM